MRSIILLNHVRNLFLIVSLVFLLVLIYPVYFGKPDDQSTESAFSALDAVVSEKNVVHAKVIDRYTSDLVRIASLYRELETVPEYLGSTEVDAFLVFDEAGNLQSTRGLRGLFDYYLSLTGDESLEEISIRIAHFLVSNLSANQAEQGWQYFQRYQEYRLALDEQGDLLQAHDDLRQRFAVIQQTRESVLGSEMLAGFFGDEQIYDQFTLNRLDVENNHDLSAQEKREQIRQLEAQLPEQWKSMRREVALVSETYEEVAMLRSEGASENEIAKIRVEKFGLDATLRLEALDREREQWNERYHAYQHEIAQLNESHLSEQDKVVERIRLREIHFQSFEMKRVEVLDEM